jgi:ribonuclease J
MLAWVRPKIVVAVHGETLHLFEHAALAKRAGVPQVIPCVNGDLVRLGPDDARLIDEVPSGRLYKDGSLIVDSTARTVNDRRRLAFSGVVSVAVAVTKAGELAADPEVDLTGIPDKDIEDEDMSAIVYDAVLDAFESMPRARRRDPETVAEALRRATRSAVAQAWQKKPVCHVQVILV